MVMTCSVLFDLQKAFDSVPRGLFLTPDKLETLFQQLQLADIGDLYIYVIGRAGVSPPNRSAGADFYIFISIYVIR